MTGEPMQQQTWLKMPYHLILLVFVIYPELNQQSEACAAVATDGGSSKETLILCRACGHELAHGTDIHFVPSRLALASRNDTVVGGRRVNVQLFENPHGHQFEVITFRKADITQHWPADKRFSWFPGFSWTVATCPRCKAHLGWAFQPSDWPDLITKSSFQESQNTFLALITHQLLTEEFASSLLMTPKSFVSR
ncbi:protein cereblon homolog [Takifugu rubripes]|uniref:protein cereblon homolog n=1 Tax=Takifugu rubripes TaxID=31033 RepID=UPI000298ECD8|nr:protein cereblon homolog [Takifugu rubripes]|eukprot:XP_003974717.1 PREDICTED: protein cereblon homolog [Takifugu rubripes]